MTSSRPHMAIASPRYTIVVQQSEVTLIGRRDHESHSLLEVEHMEVLCAFSQL